MHKLIKDWEANVVVICRFFLFSKQYIDAYWLFLLTINSQFDHIGSKLYFYAGRGTNLRHRAFIPKINRHFFPLFISYFRSKLFSQCFSSYRTWQQNNSTCSWHFGSMIKDNSEKIFVLTSICLHVDLAHMSFDVPFHQFLCKLHHLNELCNEAWNAQCKLVGPSSILV